MALLLQKNGVLGVFKTFLTFSSLFLWKLFWYVKWKRTEDEIFHLFWYNDPSDLFELSQKNWQKKTEPMNLIGRKCHTLLSLTQPQRYLPSHLEFLNNSRKYEIALSFLTLQKAQRPWSKLWKGLKTSKAMEQTVKKWFIKVSLT